MARASASWTDTTIADWVAGSFVRETKFLQQLLQNLEFFAQAHDHTGDPNGAELPFADPKSGWFYGIAGGPFA